MLPLLVGALVAAGLCVPAIGLLRKRRRAAALTEYELDMLCMIRFGFSFNCIRLLHHHENVNSLYSRRTKIHRKMGLASRYPLEDYLSELAAEGQTERSAL